MDIKFKLLIVDDNILDEEDSTYQKIKKKVESMGLIPDIKLSNGSDYKEVVKSEDYDLYLIDYSLVNDISGHEVIREIRDNNRSLTDIILYSTTNENLFQKIDKFQLDGVYICKRDDLILKTEKILEKLEKRTLNPLSLRGVVLHNYSDIEFRLRKFLLELYEGQSQEVKQVISNEVDKLVEEGNDNFTKKINECKSSEDYVRSLFLNKNYLFDMCKKINLLKLFKKYRLVNISDRDINLLKSLNNIRNNLGHAKIIIKNKEMIIQDINDLEYKYTQDECKDIKNKIIRAVKILDELEMQK